MKHILVSNDDGVHAPGLQSLVRALREIARITVIAPDRNKSAASGAITLDRSVAVSEIAPGVYAADGTPADCVHLAFTGFLRDKPDLVIAGINGGKNLGEDVLYSGTVGAAKEGPVFGVSALAVSQIESGWEHLEAAASITKSLVERLLKEETESPVFLNVNIPNLPFSALRGIRLTRLGRREPSEVCVADGRDGAQQRFLFGKQGRPTDNGAGTDFEAVQSGYVSVTPLRIDWTDLRSECEISRRLGLK